VPPRVFLILCSVNMRVDEFPEKSPVKAWVYTIDGKWTVVAGKTDVDNDRLSIKLAKPNDWWFHVRGTSGSHVLLRALPDEEPGKDILEAAAAIAAYHSKARKGGVTPVACTKAVFVTKPRGARPGIVQIRKEVVLKVRPGLPVGS
jgi:predicted ribosome quality control (RQC) complex YloA/Tae2 family protein